MTLTCRFSLFHSSANVHSHVGPTLNPAGPRGVEKTIESAENEQRVAGGSSGGSAAAVSAGLCDLFVFALPPL